MNKFLGGFVSISLPSLLYYAFARMGFLGKKIDRFEYENFNRGDLFQIKVNRGRFFTYVEYAIDEYHPGELRPTYFRWNRYYARPYSLTVHKEVLDDRKRLLRIMSWN